MVHRTTPMSIVDRQLFSMANVCASDFGGSVAPWVYSFVTPLLKLPPPTHPCCVGVAVGYVVVVVCVIVTVAVVVSVGVVVVVVVTVALLSLLRFWLVVVVAVAVVVLVVG